MDRILHIAEAAQWSSARDEGVYLISTLGKTLAEEGFIHCSGLDQVERVANAAYVGRRDLVLLVIDPERVSADIRYENSEGGLELFPHVYGPLNVDAVVEVAAFTPGPDGRFSRPW
jgi:uncharacterized protein (DUF952 family)